ncbi:MAG: DUF4469 domain-containing protein [Treponema sp.]|nr:DUF4469 domain-containing protein [Treponema sp.]
MPKRKTVPFEYNEQETPVDVVIHESNLSGGDGKVHQYGTIAHHKVTVTSILKEMEDDHSIVASKELMYYVAQELGQRMLKKFKQGYAIELLDFGTVFPTMRGSVGAFDSATELKKHFDVGFTPSKEVRAALDNYTVRTVRKVSEQHKIYSVTDILEVNRQKKELTVGLMAQVTGKAIKLGGKTFGLYAAAVSQEWVGELPERTQWIAMEHISINKPSTIQFFVEEVLKPGWYVFIVETCLSGSGKELKQSVLVSSDPVQVVARTGIV